jgi:hypothetical protein
MFCVVNMKTGFSALADDLLTVDKKLIVMTRAAHLSRPVYTPLASSLLVGNWEIGAVDPKADLPHE